MGKRFIIDVDTDDDHLLVNAGYDSVVTKAQVSSDSLSDLLSVLDASTTTGYGDIYTLPEEEPGLSTTAWIFVAVFCFAAGLSVSFWYSKGSCCLYIENCLRRCFAKRFRGRGDDPVLLTVVERESKESENKDEDEDADNEGKTETEVSSPRDKCDKEEGEKAEANDEKPEGERKSKEEDGKSSSSSSSEGEDEEGSVRHRKKGNGEGTEEGAAEQEVEKKCEEEQQHKE